MVGRIFNRILLLINSLAVVGLLLAYLSAVISPLQFSFLSVFSLAYPYFVIANILFVLFWAFIRKSYFLLSLLTLVIGYKTLINNFQFLPSKVNTENVKSESFKVMSYNVHVFDLYRWSKNKQTRDSIFNFIRKEKPGIACFQEYYNAKNNFYPVHDSLIRNQSFRYAHIYYTDRIGDFQRFGIATYSEYPIVNKEIIRFPNSNNVSIFSDIKVNEDTIRVFNCHLESIRFLPEDYNFIDSIVTQRKDVQTKGAKGVYTRLTNAFKKRAIQVDLLTEQIQQSPYPIILCGDFNDPPSSYSYSYLTKSLSDSFVEMGKGKGATFSRNVFSYRIDYILHSDQIVCSGIKVPKVDYSDHYPVIGEFSIKKDN